MKRFVGRLVDFSGRNPFIVLFVALSALAGSWWYASHLELHTDLRELLPSDSPSYKAFEHQLGRVGGGATLIVIAESPDKSANERFIDEFSDRVEKLMSEHAACVAAAKSDPIATKACGPTLISHIERGTKDVRKFYEDNKWLYADLADLKNADKTLDFQIAVKSGTVECLECDDAPPKPSASAAPSAAPSGSGSPSAPASSGVPQEQREKEPALGMEAYRERWKAKADKRDDFPTGYFENASGRMVGMRIVSSTAGTGDAAGDVLLRQVRTITDDLHPTSFEPTMKVGYAGDIPNAVAEKDSIASEAIGAFVLAILLTLGVVVWFFRSLAALAVLGLPALLGVGAAYSFAMWRYGYVNITGAFLGAIIVGNGINYPIVLLSRYREFRARGMAPEEARRDAVWNAFRAELVGACVGSIAYGSLTVTQFRGFSQFGMIGFVGMLLVWLSMIPCVPALLVAVDRIGAVVPRRLFEWDPKVRPDGSRGPLTRAIASATERAPWAFIAVAALLTVIAAWKLPKFLRDPWEYNFDALGSRASKHGGAGEWSNKAEQVFGGKMNIAGALMLADTPEQVPFVKEAIFARDALDPQGRLVSEVATVADLLPGTVEEQKEKLAVLDRIRDRLSPEVMDGLDPQERAHIEEMRPPPGLHVLGPSDLPGLLRRRFEENGARGTIVGTVFYVKFYDFARKQDVIYSDGHTLLRMAKTTDNVQLPDGNIVQTASRSTIFAEMIRSMTRDGPLATGLSFLAVMCVVILATHSFRGSFAVLTALVLGVTWALGGAALMGMKLNYVNFIALPITFGIGCEYPFNVFDRSRLLGGDVTSAVRRVGGAVALCSATTAIGYGSLLFSDQQALQSFGRLAMSGEIACLAGALFVVPSLLHLTARWARGR
jgi:predicted RND superfamily exporter protein